MPDDVPAGIDTGVAARFRAGEPAAVREVYRAYAGLVYGVAYRVLGHPVLAEEATQRAFVNAWRASSQFDAVRPLGPWLATIARRVAIDVFRSERRRQHGSIEELPTDDPAVVVLPPSAEQAYDVWAVREAVAALPPDERSVVQLQHLDALTHQEIADKLGVPVGTVKSRSHRAHRRLAAALGHLREPDPGPPRTTHVKGGP